MIPEFVGVLLLPACCYLAWRAHGLYERARGPAASFWRDYRDHSRRWRG